VKATSPAGKNKVHGSDRQVLVSSRRSGELLGSSGNLPDMVRDWQRRLLTNKRHAVEDL
jgi:hypothetical protein